jgi:hypothetical protein
MQVAEEKQQPEQQQPERQQAQPQQTGGSDKPADANANAGAPPLSDEAAASYDALFADYSVPHEQKDAPTKQEDPQLQPAAQAHHPRVDEFGDPLPQGFVGEGDAAAAAAGGDAAAFHDEPRGRNPLPDDPALSEQWGDEQGFWRSGQHAIQDQEGAAGGGDSKKPPSEHVWLDAHVLATPAVGDVDGDGHPEVVVPVSYFFDRAQYEGRRSREVEGLDLSKYVAGEFFFCFCFAGRVSARARFRRVFFLSGAAMRDRLLHRGADALLSPCAFVARGGGGKGCTEPRTQKR